MFNELQGANVIDDLRHFTPSDDDFQLIPPHTAGWLIFTMVCLAVILEPVLR